MDIKNKLQLLTLQLRLRQLILDGKSLLRLLYPTSMWSYLMVHGSLVVVSVFGLIVLATNIF